MGELEARKALEPLHWTVVARRYYVKALAEAERRGISEPVALIRAVEKLREASFTPPHRVRLLSLTRREIDLEEQPSWPLPRVDWSPSR